MFLLVEYVFLEPHIFVIKDSANPMYNFQFWNSMSLRKDFLFYENFQINCKKISLLKSQLARNKVSRG